MSSAFNADTPGLRTATSKDGAVLFDLEHDRFLKLNSVAAEMWRRLNAGNTESQIIDSISEQYGVDKQRVATDLHTLLVRIAELGVDLSRSKSAEPEQVCRDHGAGSSRFRFAQDTKEHGTKPRGWLVFCSILGLATFDLALWAASLKWLCRAVRAWPSKDRAPKDVVSVIGQVCSAVEKGCVWYPKKTLCLQRSAVTACLLRRQGIAARLVIGARPIPFLAHAWVEVEGSVVNDLPRVKDFYHALASY